MPLLAGRHFTSEIRSSAADVARRRHAEVRDATRQGKVNWFDEVVYPAPGRHDIGAAVAVQLGSFDAVAWVEQTSGGERSVTAQRFTCN